MTRIAFLADVHGHCEALQRAIADATTWGAEQFYALGDIGDGDCLVMLREIDALPVFGNWEASRWASLSLADQAWVRNWPPLRYGEDFVVAHATVDWPSDITDVAAAAREVSRRGGHWLSLFPSLDRDEPARWRTIVALETAGKRILFHGHTHVQETWQFDQQNKLRRLRETTWTVEEDKLYLVGVGSIGQSLDGPGICYARYDRATGRVTLRRLRQ